MLNLARNVKKWQCIGGSAEPKLTTMPLESTISKAFQYISVRPCQAVRITFGKGLAPALKLSRQSLLAKCHKPIYAAWVHVKFREFLIISTFLIRVG